MKNKNRYKETFSAIFPSEDAVEGVYKMTNDKRKTNNGKALKRILAAALTFILVLGGGFGADYAIEKYVTNSVSNNNKLSVLVAYAGEKEFLKIENANNEQKLFGKLYVAFHSDEEKMNKIYNEYIIEQDRIDKFVEKYIEEGESVNRPISYNSNIDYIYAEDDIYEETELGWIISVFEGEITLNIDDYSNVKDIIFENSSKYGELMIEHYTWNPVQTLEGHKITVSGKELQYAVDNGFFLPKGYIFSWHITKSLLDEFANNENFELSNVKDTITFTVNYLDGTSETASVDLTFDNDGTLRLSDGSLTK